MKINKYFFAKLLLFVFLFSCFYKSHSQTRNTLWLDGLSTTSLGWGNTPNQLKDLENYDLFNVISLQGLPASVYQPQNGVFGAGDILSGNIGGYDNIIGFGHDYGGLVLRRMANGNNTLSAMVLNGVPNLGSNGISFAIESTGTNGLSEAQRIINGVQAIKSGENCEGCQLVETFEAWVNELKANEAIFSQMLPNSDVIHGLNQAQNMPQIPFVVFYGTKEDLSISSLMSSWYFPNTGDADYFSKCYTEELERQRANAEDVFTQNTINSTLGFFGGAIKFIGAIVKDSVPSPATVLTSISNFIASQKEVILNDIRAVKAKDEELARILRCEIANQLLATEWQLALAANGSFDTEEVEYVPTYSECYDYCESEGWEDFYFDFFCMPNCLNSTFTETVYVTDSNDGLLLQGEQLLGGAEKTYHLYETNHFQESNLGHGVLLDHFQDLFDGGAGPAFIISN